MLRLMRNTSKEYVDSEHLDPTNNGFRFGRIEKKHACTFTGAIQFICVMWKFTLREDAFTEKPIYRNSHNILSRMEIKMNQKYETRRYISRL